LRGAAELFIGPNRFFLSLRKKKKELHLIGAINEILMKCATYGAG
jgi:hypothetical protein